MSNGNVLQAVSIATAIAVGIFLGLAVADSSRATLWILTWQTLIAGILAVVAATLTVLQMQRIEARQQRRHEQLVGFKLRAERMTIERAAYYTTVFRERAASAAAVARSLKSMTNDAPPYIGTANEFQWAEIKVFADWVRVLNANIAEAEGLFDPELAYCRSLMLQQVARFEHDLPVLMEAITYKNETAFFFSRARMRMAAEIVEASLQRMAGGLEEVRDRYRQIA